MSQKPASVPAKTGHNRIDHVAVGAQTLTQGVNALEALLGVTVPLGSKHDAMSTHNCVMQAGNSSFFEVIAVDPDAPDLGEVVSFARGDRTWRLTVPADGSLPMGGLIPAFIEWSPGPHPSTGQQNLGVSLKRIHLRHPTPADLHSVLDALGVAHLVEVQEGPASLAFEMETPRGVVILD